MKILMRRLSKRHTPWFFSTDFFKPETSSVPYVEGLTETDSGYVFDTGYFVVHGFGFQLAIYWSR